MNYTDYEIIPAGLRVILIIATLFVLAYMIYSSYKQKMEVRYAILWITWALFILILAIFPGIARALASSLGIAVTSNFIFLVMIALLFLFNYYLYLRMSKMKQDITNLNYELSVLKQKLDKKEGNEETKKSDR